MRVLTFSLPTGYTFLKMKTKLVVKELISASNNGEKINNAFIYLGNRQKQFYDM